ncbi:putative quinol monooxygenase [Celerinatantimonas yamalensis]|uniref:Antibiotic biosynthesis monooxygenase n=1 Tax=Celerinatantimonas yamalensis TaxID=559956 RepID=A0ABW9G3I0_9GAMM
MLNKHLFVMAKITPKAAFFEAAKIALLSLVGATRNEVDCIQFEIHVSPCGQFIYLYEEWTDQAALNNHHQEKQTKAVAQKIEHWLAAPTEVALMNKLEQSAQSPRQPHFANA